MDTMYQYDMVSKLKKLSKSNTYRQANVGRKLKSFQKLSNAMSARNFVT